MFIELTQSNKEETKISINISHIVSIFNYSDEWAEVSMSNGIILPVKEKREVIPIY